MLGCSYELALCLFVYECHLVLGQELTICLEFCHVGVVLS